MLWEVMIDSILSDLMEVLCYLPYCTLVGICAAGFALLSYVVGRRVKVKHICVWCLFLIYLLLLLQTVFFSREIGSRPGGIDWRILPNWQQDIWRCIYAIENVIMFLPFGFMTPLLMQVFRKMPICIAVAALISIGIETIQYVTERGYCQLEDVVMNVIGAIIGFGLWVLGYFLVSVFKGANSKTNY